MIWRSAPRFPPRLLAMYLMSKHLESDVKNKKKKSFGKASFCVHVTRTIVKDVPFFSRATVFACPIMPNVNEPFANCFRHRLVGDVFLAKRCAWHAASDILLAFVFGLFFKNLFEWRIKKNWKALGLNFIELSRSFPYCVFEPVKCDLLLFVCLLALWTMLYCEAGLLPVLISSAIRLTTCLAKRCAWNEALFADVLC